MKIRVTTMSDMGASRIDNILRSSVLNRQSNARMGVVKERFTYSNFIEARAHIEIPHAHEITLTRIKEWFMECIRHTYKGPGFVVMVERLDDGAPLDPPELSDDPYAPELYSFIYGDRQPSTFGRNQPDTSLEGEPE